jgi:hypothetical protein
MVKSFQIVVIVSCLNLVLSSCGDTEDAVNSETPDLQEATFENVGALLTRKCGGCHGDTGLGENFQMAGGVDATLAQVQASLVDVNDVDGLPLLVPNNPAASQIYARLLAEGTRLMPLGKALDQPDIDLVKRWIEEGASFE